MSMKMRPSEPQLPTRARGEPGLWAADLSERVGAVVRLRILLLSLSAGLVACGGPISDFPRNSGGDNEAPSAGDGDDASEGGDGDGDGTGVSDPDDGADVDGGAASDGGVDAGPEDGGVPACSHGSDAGEGCFGIYCAQTLDDLTARSAPALACIDAAELALVCEGELPRTATRCTADHLGDDDRITAIATCLRAEASLADAGDDCLGCYAAEAECALTGCFEDCFGGVPGACDACREASCGEAFRACSGLPTP